MPTTLPCPDCDWPISTRAAICPHCGRKHPHPNPVYLKALEVGCLVFVLVMAASIVMIWGYGSL